MSVRKNTPCDLDGVCPYEAEQWGDCEYWCGADEPQDTPEDWDEEECFEPGRPYISMFELNP